MARETMEFGPLVVTFDERVLRPRPWTVRQATWAAELSPGLPPGPILELCSGVGHIGQAAAVRTGRALVQVDVDPHACELAEANAGANGLADVQVRCDEVDTGVRAGERFALILADPPYVPEDEVEDLPDDPDHTVDGGPDGLTLLRRCVAVAGAHVADGGAVLLQTLGAAQVDRLARDLADAGLRAVDVRAEDDRRAVVLLRPATGRVPAPDDRRRG